MVRWPVVLALVVSLGICGISELRARRKYDETQHQIALRKSELQKLADIDQQVRAYQKKKDALQHRIDLLQQVYSASNRGTR